jgi:hypothetical protein
VDSLDEGNESQVDSEPVESSAPEAPAVDREAVEAKVGNKLAELFGDDADAGAASDDGSADSSKAPDNAEADGASVVGETSTTADDTGEGEEEKKEEAVAKAPQKGANVPTLPDSYRRSLKAYGWEDAEIDKNLAVLGNDFIATAAKIHSNRNAEVGQWAEVGRQAREQQTAAAAAANSGKDVTKASSPSSGLQPIDVESLKKEYGDDTLITKFVGPFNAAIEQINTKVGQMDAILPLIEQMQQRAHQAELDMMSRQIDGFFGDKDLASYKEVYGAVGSELSKDHLTARNKVLEMADALIVGAQMQNRKLSFGEAMRMAHDSVSSGFKKQEVREELKQKLTTRAKGITLKPSSHKAPASNGPVSRADLERRVAAKLKAL